METRRITVRFSCPECGLLDHTVLVRARSGPEEDLIEWMQNEVIAACGARHELMSPLCRTKGFTNLKIPIDNNDQDSWVGKYTPQVPPIGDPRQEGGK